jgi:hypothetical protein
LPCANFNFFFLLHPFIWRSRFAAVILSENSSRYINSGLPCWPNRLFTSTVIPVYSLSSFLQIYKYHMAKIIRPSP